MSDMENLYVMLERLSRNVAESQLTENEENVNLHENRDPEYPLRIAELGIPQIAKLDKAVVSTLFDETVFINVLETREGLRDCIPLFSRNRDVSPSTKLHAL